MAWDATVADSYSESHIGNTATEAEQRRNRQPMMQTKFAKYDELASTHTSFHRNRRYLESLGC